MPDNNPWANAPLTEAMPFGAGATPEGSPTVFSNMISGLFGMPKHLIDAAKEAPVGVPPSEMTPEEQNRAQNLINASTQTAMGLAGAGAPAAEAGAAGIFGGKLAKGADIRALIEANAMRDGSVPMSRIYNDTGWFNSPTDKKWRFEIPDDRSRMMQHGLNYAEEGNSVTGPAHMMLQHPELFKNYPQLKDMPFTNSVYHNPRNGVGTGYFDLPNNMIETNAPNLRNAREVALHELQHGVQGIENFSAGGNPSYMAYLKEKQPSKIPAFEAASDPYDMYHRLGGEVESRNVQTRADFTPVERKITPPWKTHDVKYNDQLAFDPRSDLVRALRRSQ